MTASPTAGANHSRFETLDGMRGVAAWVIMIHHYPVTQPTRLFFNAHVAVDLFYMMSGFVLMHSYGPQLRQGMPARDYLLKRLIRLHPFFILGLVLGTAVLLALIWNDSTTSAGSLATATVVNAFYLPYTGSLAERAMNVLLVATPKIFPSNPPTWSLFFEVVGSIAFLGLVRLKRPALIALAAASFATFAVAGFLNERLEDHVTGIDFNLGWSPTWSNLLGGLPRVFYAFPLGMLIYSFTRDQASAPWRTFVQRWVPCPYALYLVLLLVLLIPFDARGLVSFAVLTMVAPALIFCGAAVTCDNPASYSAAKFLGSLSYPVYCLHFPIERTVFFLSQRYHVPSKIALLAAIGLTLGAAIVLLRFYDIPMRRFLKKRFASASTPRRSPANAAAGA